jgi:hypothetical protein
MQTRYELILSAVDKGVKAAFNRVREGVTRGSQAMKAFNEVWILASPWMPPPRL